MSHLIPKWFHIRRKSLKFFKCKEIYFVSYYFECLDENESTPRPVQLEDENDLLYPVQKSPAPPLGAESIPSEEQVSPMEEVTPNEDNAPALGIEISPSKDKASEGSYSVSLNKVNYKRNGQKLSIRT